MAMDRCLTCDTWVDRNAAACPRCGRPAPVGGILGWSHVIGGAILFVLFSMFVAAVSG